MALNKTNILNEKKYTAVCEELCKKTAIKKINSNRDSNKKVAQKLHKTIYEESR